MQQRSPKKNRFARRSEALALIGVYPPPYGGVSIHIKRMVEYLAGSGFDFVLYNTGPEPLEHEKVVNIGWSLARVIQVMLGSRHRLVHMHTGRWWVRVLLSHLARLGGKRMIFTAHSYAFCQEFTQGNRLRRWLVKRSLRQAAAIIAVNQLIREELLRLGLAADQVEVIPAFLPPARELSAAALPDPVREFCRGKTPILVANGAYVLNAGRDVYGLRTLKELTLSLLPHYPDLGVVLYLREGGNFHEGHFADLQREAGQSPLSQHLLCYRSRDEFYPIYARADLFLRPTLTDGDAISIREALHYGVPVVASNPVERPAGTILYEVERFPDLVEKVQTALAHLAELKHDLKSGPVADNAARIAALYEKILARDGRG